MPAAQKNIPAAAELSQYRFIVEPPSSVVRLPSFVVRRSSNFGNHVSSDDYLNTEQLPFAYLFHIVANY
jgi:hypothetical protein